MEENTQDRYQNNVHGGNKTGFSRIGINKTDLLQAGGDEQGNAADQTGFPQIRIFPAFDRFREAALFTFQQEGTGNQKSDGKTAPDKLKSKRTDKVHAHALGNESKAPDGCTQQQTKAAFPLIFHNKHHRRLLYHNSGIIARGVAFLR